MTSFIPELRISFCNFLITNSEKYDNDPVSCTPVFTIHFSKTSYGCNPVDPGQHELVKLKHKVWDHFQWLTSELSRWEKAESSCHWDSVAMTARPQGHKATRVGVKQVTHLVYPGNGLSIRTHLLFEVTVKAILLRRAWWASPCCLHLKKTSANRNSLGSKLPFHIPTILSARTLNQMSSFHSPSELFASCGTGNNQNIRWWP